MVGEATSHLEGPRPASRSSPDAHPLGWGLRTTPGARNQRVWLIPLEELPRLSLPEAQVAAQIRDAFFQQPTSASASLPELRRAIQSYCEAHTLILQPDQRKDIETILVLATQEAGPLTPLLREPCIEEIALTGVGERHPVRVFHVREGWMDTPLFFTRENEVVALLNRLARNSGKRLSGSTPILNAIIQGGNRLHAAQSPVAGNKIEASIRKFVARATHPSDLLRLRVLPPEALTLLTAAMQSDSSLLLVGNTGSGKTTTLNALLGCLPENERMILVEETPELHLAHPHVVNLHPSPEVDLSFSRVIRETLRMRPDRVVIGEVRFPEEAHAFMECVLAGQGKGTYATFHGHSAAEALARLRQFGVRDADIGWIPLLVVQKRWTVHAPKRAPREMRAITEIVELHSRDGTFSLNPLFAWNDSAHRLEAKNPSVRIREAWSRAFPKQKWSSTP